MTILVGSSHRSILGRAWCECRARYLESDGAKRQELRQSIVRPIPAVDSSELFHTRAPVDRREHRKRVTVDHDLPLVVKSVSPLITLGTAVRGTTLIGIRSRALIWCCSRRCISRTRCEVYS